MIRIISGPPCAGKSTYVKENAKDGDLRIDYDLIAQALGAVNSHAAEGLIKQAAFDAREGAIKTAVSNPDADSWIIHTSPSKEHLKMYEEVGAEVVELDPGKEICLERALSDNRPQQTLDGIEKWYSGKKGVIMEFKKKTYEVKSDNGVITGYASTWTREPDSYGDVVAKGAFSECIAQIKAEGKVLPLLFNHDANNLNAYIGTVYDLEEDEHGLLFTAEFDDTPEAQKARKLAVSGRVVKFSFAYDILDQAEVTLEDGRKANELRKLNIHEVSLVLYPANPDTSVIEVKAGRRNRKTDEDIIKQIISLANQLLDDEIDDTERTEESEAKSEELDTVNDEELMRKAELLKQAEELLTKGAE